MIKTWFEILISMGAFFYLEICPARAQAQDLTYNGQNRIFEDKNDTYSYQPLDPGQLPYMYKPQAQGMDYRTGLQTGKGPDLPYMYDPQKQNILTPGQGLIKTPTDKSTGLNRVDVSGDIKNLDTAAGRGSSADKPKKTISESFIEENNMDKQIIGIKD
jgi:hypothetical protein